MHKETFQKDIRESTVPTADNCHLVPIATSCQKYAPWRRAPSRHGVHSGVALVLTAHLPWGGGTKVMTFTFHETNILKIT